MAAVGDSRLPFIAILAAVLRRSSRYLIRKTLGKGEVLKPAASRFLATHFSPPPSPGVSKRVSILHTENLEQLPPLSSALYSRPPPAIKADPLVNPLPFIPDGRWR